MNSRASKREIRAFLFYEKWTRLRYSLLRTLVVALLSAVLTATAYCLLLDALEVSAFEFLVFMNLCVLFASIGALGTFITYWAHISISWTIVGRAKVALTATGDRCRPWHILIENFGNVHPKVVQNPEVRALLARAFDQALEVNDRIATTVYEMRRKNPFYFGEDDASPAALDRKLSDGQKISALLVTFAVLITLIHYFVILFKPHG